MEDIREMEQFVKSDLLSALLLSASMPGLLRFLWIRQSIRFFSDFSRKKTLLILLSFFLMTIMFPSTAFAEKETEGVVKESLADPGLQNSPGMIDRTQERISSGVLNTARKIDSFFKEDNYQTEENTSSLRIRLDTVVTEGEGAEFSINPTLRLVLPYTEKRLHLEIMSSADRNLDILYEKTPMALKQFDQTRKESPTATLRYFFSSRDNQSISMVAGTRSDDGNLEFYIGPRYRGTFIYNLWSFQFIEWLRWTSDEGIESHTVFDADRALTKTLLMRIRLFGDWLNSKDEFSHGIRFLLFQPINNNRALAYEWNNLLTNQPNHRIEEINFRVKYRQQFLRDWLFFEMAPQIAFPMDRDFKATPGFLFRVEIYFGFQE